MDVLNCTKGGSQSKGSPSAKMCQVFCEEMWCGQAHLTVLTDCTCCAECGHSAARLRTCAEPKSSVIRRFKDLQSSRVLQKILGVGDHMEACHASPNQTAFSPFQVVPAATLVLDTRLENLMQLKISWIISMYDNCIAMSSCTFEHDPLQRRLLQIVSAR